jgi:uncharacterized protein YbjT (DUF2867 family)
MQPTKPLIAVIGATGAQGGGLVRAILADPNHRFAARAITRDAGSPAARELARLGAEVVAADLDEPASVARAFTGADGAFCVTPFWAHMSTDRELAQARAMAEAARAARVRHVVWSTLEDTRRWIPVDDPRMPTLGGRYKVPHFDAKGEANAFFRDLDVPTTLLHTSFYWDNLIHFGMGPRRGADGTLALTLPMADARLPGIAAEDIGRCALGIFAGGAREIGKSYGIAGEHPTGAEMAATLGKALGEPVVYAPMSFAAYRDLGFAGADDLGNMFQFYVELEREFCAARPVALARTLNPSLQTFEDWAVRNASRIPIA